MTEIEYPVLSKDTLFLNKKQCPFIVACVPAYNTEGTIAKVILKAQQFVDKVIVCDDGSQDLTATIAERMGAMVIKHERNLGYGAALKSLFHSARMVDADIMITIDADGQHEPGYIPQMLQPILNHKADVVIGSRFLDEGKSSVPEYRKQGIRFINFVTGLAGYKGLTDSQSGMRAYDKKAIQMIVPTEKGMGASTEILLKAKKHSLRLSEVPIAIEYNEQSSTQNPLKHGLSVVVSTFKYWSINRPLTFWGYAGLIFFFLGMVFWLWALTDFLINRYFSANIVISALTMTSFGLIFLTTGVILSVLVSVVHEGAL